MAMRGDNGQNAAQLVAQNAAKEHSEYLAKLRTEFGQIDQSLTATNKLLQNEIDRMIKGGDGSKPIEIHRDNAMKLTTKLMIPNKEFPKVNFVGKLIGPKGANMRRLQDELGVRLAVYGRGSMRDKNKEEELRKEGGKKYGHLNDDLHVYVEVSAPADTAYQMMGRAIAVVKPYFDPNFDDGSMMQEMDPYSNGAPPMAAGRGRGRGAAPLLGAGRGRGGPVAAAPPRGGARGAAPAVASRERAPAGYGGEDDYYGAAAAAPPSRNSAAYVGYSGDSGYEQESYRAPARDPYANSRARASASHDEVQSFDYGHGSSDSYSAATQDTWERRDPYSRAPAPRGRSTAGEHRAHPYGERAAARQQQAPRY